MKNGTITPQGQTAITVQIAGMKAPDTRMVQGPGTTTINTLTGENHYIYVLKSDAEGTVIYGETLKPAEVAGQTLGEGETMYFPDDSRIYILANIPSDVTNYTWDKVANLAAIKALTSTITYDQAGPVNTDLTAPAMSNFDGEPVAVGDPVSGLATANVKISPLYARIEFVGVKGLNHIESFDVAGVYLDNYYSVFSMTGEAKGSLHSNGSAKTFPAGWFGDAGPWNAPTGVTAGPGWAYHAAPAAKVPSIIVELKNLTFKYDNGSGTPTTTAPVITDSRFLTVASYNNKTGGTPYTGQFERGKIYKISLLTFDHVYSDDSNDDNDDVVPDTPNPTSVTLKAVVTVENWAPVELSPNLGE
jgi:hypothetical protein